MTGGQSKREFVIGIQVRYTFINKRNTVLNNFIYKHLAGRFNKEDSCYELCICRLQNNKGKNPVFITVDKTNKYLVVATLQGGFVCSLKRNEDGTIGEMVSNQSFHRYWQIYI